METEIVKVIVKMETVQGMKRVILFFPETPVNRGNIQAWTCVGEHCEACLRYFWELRPPREEDEVLVTKTLALYQRRYQVAGRFVLKRVKRDTQAMRVARWKR